MKVQEKQIGAPRPIYPKSVRHHGLFGKAFVRQHMIIDDRWTPVSLSQEFEKMTLLLRKFSQFKRLERKVKQKDVMKAFYSLRKQCREGRSNLKLLLAGSPQEVKNILKDHLHLQRLYQKMPLNLAVENMNQRTFFMRKERDRLQNRLLQLEKAYEEKFRQKGDLENRIKYENEFQLDEDKKIIDLMKKLENSKIRLQANMTINSTYKGIIQVLRHDATFYFPILRSLDDDVEDQSQFIRHILHLGTPALERFQKLSNEYILLDDKARKSSRQSLAELSRKRKMLFRPYGREPKVSQRGLFVKVTRYVRETKSMLDLKEKFEEIEDVIRQIKIAIVCSDEKEIYPRIKTQVKHNLALGAKIETDGLSHEVFETKMKNASVLQDVLINNFNEKEIERLEKIKNLKEEIKKADEFEESALAHMKRNANIFVLLRTSLWNLHDIMRHVGPRRVTRVEYPASYLKLPLLQYDMLAIKAYPPDAFEQNIMKLLRDAYSKVKLLTNAFNWSESSINVFKVLFCEYMMNGRDSEKLSLSGQDLRYKIEVPAESSLIDIKSYRTVPDRNAIKLASARIVDINLKKDD